MPQIEILDRLIAIEKVLVRQDAHLSDHLRRTEAVEKQIPGLVAHVRRVEGAGRFFAILMTLFAAAISLLHYLHI